MTTKGGNKNYLLSYAPLYFCLLSYGIISTRTKFGGEIPFISDSSTPLRFARNDNGSTILECDFYIDLNK